MLDGGVARCWGELGDNTQMSKALKPVAIGGDLRFASLDAFGRTVCGVTAEGAGYCWGPNTDGQLGTGATDAGSATPVAIKGNLRFAMIAAGDPTTCGITVDGAAYCWGQNGDGEVGNGDASTTDVVEPAPVAGGLAFATVSVSRGFACGVAKDGAAYCWGSNTYGQLGNGKPITGQTTDLSKVPSKVVGGHSFTSVTTGAFHACGLTTAGTAVCWGRNDYQFGNGSDQSSSTPMPVGGNQKLVQLDAGKDFTCGITESRAALCWGANGAGQLGNGDHPPADLSRAPVPVVGGVAFDQVRASDGDHTCALAADHTAVYCWGRNDRGQLGNGSTAPDNGTRSPTPSKVGG